MNNIQKAFKKKADCGLRRSYADGGLLGAADVAQYTNDPDALNAASTAKWAEEERQRQLSHPGQAFLNPVQAQKPVDPMAALGTKLDGLTNTLDSFKPKPVQAPTFQDDIDNRQNRINGLRGRLGYADGGVVETPGEKLMREMAAKYGAPAGGPSQPAPQPVTQPVQVAPAPQPAQQPAQGRGILNLLRGRNQQIDKAAGYAKGGTVDSDGYIHGEKGVDKVAAEVAETGEPIRVGAGERIVNKAQNAALEKLTATHGVGLDDYLQEATGEPVGPTMKKGLRGAVLGGEFGEGKLDLNAMKAQQAAIESGQMTANEALAANKGAMNGIPSSAQVDRAVAQRTAQAAAQPAATVAAETAQPAATVGERVANARAAFNGKNATTVGDLVGKAGDLASRAKPSLGTVGSVTGGALAGAGIEGAVRGYNTGTDEYAQRMGIEQPTSGLGQLGLRAAGVLSDVGAATINTGALIPNLIMHGLNTKDWYDYRNNFADVEAAKKKAAAEGQKPADTTAKPADKAADAAAAANAASAAPQLTPGTVTLKDGKPDLSFVGTHKFNDPDGKAFDAYGKAGGSVVRMSDGRTALVGANDDGQTQRDAEFAKAGYKKDVNGNWTHKTEAMQKQLDQIKRERAEYNAFDDSITDPEARQTGLRQVLTYLQQDKNTAEAAAANAKARMEVAKFNQEERKMGNLQGNSDRDFAQKESDTHEKRVDDLLKSWATGADGKLDNQKYTALNKYAAQFARKPDKDGKLPSSDQALKDLMDNHAVDSLFEEQGRHWSSPETPWAGEAVRKATKSTAGLPSLLDGRMPGQAMYRDPATGRVIYDSDVVRNLSPDQLAIFNQRFGNLK